MIASLWVSAEKYTLYTRLYGGKQIFKKCEYERNCHFKLCLKSNSSLENIRETALELGVVKNNLFIYWLKIKTGLWELLGQIADLSSTWRYSLWFAKPLIERNNELLLEIAYSPDNKLEAQTPKIIYEPFGGQ